MSESRSGSSSASGAVPRPIGDILAKSPSLNRTDAVSWWTWLDVVGARVAARSSPERIDQQTLWVAVEGSAWAAELSLLAPMILARLKAKKLKVQVLKFRVGAVRVPERRPAVPVPEARPLPAELEARLDLLRDDPQLQAVIRAAAQLTLARG